MFALWLAFGAPERVRSVVAIRVPAVAFGARIESLRFLARPGLGPLILWMPQPLPSYRRVMAGTMGEAAVRDHPDLVRATYLATHRSGYATTTSTEMRELFRGADAQPQRYVLGDEELGAIAPSSSSPSAQELPSTGCSFSYLTALKVIRQAYFRPSILVLLAYRGSLSVRLACWTRSPLTMQALTCRITGMNFADGVNDEVRRDDFLSGLRCLPEPRIRRKRTSSGMEICRTLPIGRNGSAWALECRCIAARAM
jgi:hypothetical protein